VKKREQNKFFNFEKKEKKVETRLERVIRESTVQWWKINYSFLVHQFEVGLYRFRLETLPNTSRTLLSYACVEFSAFSKVRDEGHHAVLNQCPGFFVSCLFRPPKFHLKNSFKKAISLFRKESRLFAKLNKKSKYHTTVPFLSFHKFFQCSNKNFRGEKVR